MIIKITHHNIPMLRTFQTIENLPYIPCPNPSHQSSPLNLICADPSCPSCSLLCIHCQDENHSSHDILPLKEYLRKLMVTTRTDLEERNFMGFVGEIEKAKGECLGYLGSFRDEVVAFVDALTRDVETKYREYADRVREIVGIADTVGRFVSMYETLGQWCNSDQSVVRSEEELKTFDQKMRILERQMQKILQYAKLQSFEPLPTDQQDQCNRQKQYKITSLSTQISILSNSFSQKCHKTTKQLKKLQQQIFSDSLSKIYKTLQSQTSTIQIIKGTKFSWSQVFRTSAIAINGDTVDRKSGLSMERFALFNQELKPYVERRKKAVWVMKIVKLVGWIGLGVCLKDKIVSGGYKFTYENLGHGSYMISSNGYSWSSSVKTSNSAYYSTFNYTTNDFVVIQFDPQPNWRLNFYIVKQSTLLQKAALKGGSQLVQIPAKYLAKYQNSSEGGPPLSLALENLVRSHSLDLEKSGDYYPCVNLCSVGDSVQIVG